MEIYKKYTYYGYAGSLTIILKFINWHPDTNPSQIGSICIKIKDHWITEPVIGWNELYHSTPHNFIERPFKTGELDDLFVDLL